MKSPWTLILIASWFSLINIGNDTVPKTLGVLMPVVDNFTITRVEPVLNGVHIYGSFDKIRNCAFESVDAALVSDQGRSHVSLDFKDAEQLRTIGSHTYGPWFMRMSPKQLNSLELAVDHRCFMGLTVKTYLK